MSFNRLRLVSGTYITEYHVKICFVFIKAYKLLHLALT